MSITIKGGFSTANKEQMQKLFDDYHPFGKTRQEKAQRELFESERANVEKAKKQEIAIEKVKSQPIKEAEKIVEQEIKSAKKKKK